MERVTLEQGALHLDLLPALGGSIARLEWQAENRTIPILRGTSAPREVLDVGCFPLVPYCNRIRGGRFRFRGREIELRPNMAGDPNPLHGQGWTSGWSVEALSDRSATLTFRHERDEWPWRYHARQRFTLAADSLTVELSCSNMDDGAMPCGLGLHPYFPCRPLTRITTRVAHVWTVDEQVLPVERILAKDRYDPNAGPICGRGLDNGYDGWSGEALIETPDAPFRLRMTSAEARFFQIYAPPTGALFVAEPVSHANAALNAPEEEWDSLGLRVLAPGETMRLTMRLEVEPV